MLGLIQAIRNIMNASTEHEDLKRKNQEPAKYNELARKLQATRTTNTLLIVKNVCDAVNVSQGLGYPKTLLGIEFNEGICGLGGFTSAALQCYQTFPSK